MNEEQDEELRQAPLRPDLLREEVARPERLGVNPQELVPTALSTLGPGVEAGGLQDVDDRGPADPADAEFLEFPQDAGVPPAVLPGQTDDDLADFLVGPWAPTFARRAAGVVRTLRVQKLEGGLLVCGMIGWNRGTAILASTLESKSISALFEG
ncbi:MAG TPA: hypothetical protein VM219_04660, partial [Phycisphaerae bacterium]|nr:hypothetical protein [Phycisphaerae bacterium]